MFKRVFFLFLFFFYFSQAWASIYFSEIMYDPEGSDTGQEWVEIKNDFNYSVDLEKYKFCDSGYCHSLNSENNDFKIPANSFGIIARDAEKFKLDFPNFSGFLLTASFSLKNSDGELLELKNQNKDLVAQIKYNPEVGGENGDTLSLIGDVWKNSQATPGQENQEKTKENTQDSTSSTTKSSKTDDEKPKIRHSYVEISDLVDGKKRIKVKIDPVPVLVAGAENIFTAKVFNIDGVQFYDDLEYFWNFGDGYKSSLAKPNHSYLSPGNYILTLIVKEWKFFDTDRVIVKVVKNPLEISAVDVNKNWVELKNPSNNILNIGHWKIFVDGDTFEIPENTLILNNSDLKFLNQITNFDVREKSNIFLLYPNGEKAFVYDWNKKEKIVVGENKDIDSKNTDKKEKEKKEKEKVKIENVKAKKNKKNDKKVLEKTIEKKSVTLVNKKVQGEKDDFSQRNFLANNQEKSENEKSENFRVVELKDYGYFVKQNIGTMVFWFLTFGVMMFSFWVINIEEKKFLDDDVLDEVLEYEIEEK